LPQDRYSPGIDQGTRCFKFWFNGGAVRERLARIGREALARNEKPFVLSFFPAGLGVKTKPIVVLSDEVVQVTAVKRAESNSDLIVRLFEPTGKRRKTIVSFPFAKKRIKLNFDGFEIKTLRFNPRTGRIKEVNLLESS